MRIIKIGRIAAWLTAAAIAFTTTLSVILLLWFAVGHQSIDVQRLTLSHDKLILIVFLAAVLPWITLTTAIIQRLRTGLRLR